ncbi:DUF2264 domain-containing protein [Nonomuraea sp. NPDC050643]|uniref:DUF2264 domain-containing protein n=1 Tax=Nonomuraea sp. NPDC050643 TaxID=3155660 RepID=UPI0033F28FA5
MISPYTGWTRDHWAELADRLLLSARAHASPSHARVGFPGPPGGYGADVDGLEGFARTLLAAGFRVAGEDGRDPLDLMEWYAQGIAAGTDPHSPERWVRLDEHGQAKVEAASLALVLHLTRPWLWDRLTPLVREQVVDYLAPAVGSDYPPINWVWFQIVVEQFLASVGGPYAQEDIDAGLALADSFEREDGWYADGAERSYDHYAGWALHFYPLLWSEMAGRPPEPRYLARLERYLDDAVHLVGADGSPLIQGRSLAYRFAAAAPFWAGARAGVGSPGLLRRAASGIARHFAVNGAPDGDGVLTLGWHGPWPAIAQDYSGPGSPYWASKGFLGLSLPADHPVWTAVEEPLPVEEGDFARVVRAPGWLVSGTRADGVVRVVNHGTDHSHPGSGLADHPLYARLGYSTATFPPLSGDPLDQSVVLLDGDGRASHRTGFTAGPASAAPSGTLVGSSRWRAHWGEQGPGPDHGYSRPGAEMRHGPELEVVSAVRGAWEVRFVRLSGGSGRLRVGGWPAPEGGPATRVLGGPGLTERGTAVAATPLGERTLVPWCATPGDAEPGHWYTATLLLGHGDVPPTVDGTRVTWPDGTIDDLLLPGARPFPPASQGTLSGKSK